MSPIVHRAVWLLAWLIAVILSGLGLHLLATLVPGEDLTLVRDLAGDRSSALTALAMALRGWAEAPSSCPRRS